MIFSTRVGDVRGMLATKTDEAGPAESLGVFGADGSDRFCMGAPELTSGGSGRFCVDSPELCSGDSFEGAAFEADLDISGTETSVI